MTSIFIMCPRCRKRTLKVWKHVCNRFVCSGSWCPVYEYECRNSKCEYPVPKGARTWHDKHGGTFWVHGKYVDKEIERIYSQPIEPVPHPFNQRRYNDGTIR